MLYFLFENNKTMERECKNCNKKTNNKVYCSEECQYEGYKQPTAKRIKKNCLFCNEMFEDTEYRINVIGKKYCSRNCKDTHQKEIYSGENNPSFARKITEDEKIIRSKATKKLWKQNGHKERVKIGQKKFKDKNGYWPGTDDNSNQKRKETNLSRYGVDHNWKNKEIREKGEKTTILKYGKSSLELARIQLFKTQETNIEKIIKNILEKNNIKYVKNFYVFFNMKEYKIYDFFLEKNNILIEADGDYWHGNSKIFKSLNEIQKMNIKNDKFKNDLAKQQKYNLIRFWENEIKEEKFENLLLNKIKQYDKKNKNKKKN